MKQLADLVGWCADLGIHRITLCDAHGTLLQMRALAAAAAHDATSEAIAPLLAALTPALRRLAAPCNPVRATLAQLAAYCVAGVLPPRLYDTVPAGRLYVVVLSPRLAMVSSVSAELLSWKERFTGENWSALTDARRPSTRMALGMVRRRSGMLATSGDARTCVFTASTACLSRMCGCAPGRRAHGSASDGRI